MASPTFAAVATIPFFVVPLLVAAGGPCYMPFSSPPPAPLFYNGIPLLPRQLLRDISVTSNTLQKARFYQLEGLPRAGVQLPVRASPRGHYIWAN